LGKEPHISKEPLGLRKSSHQALEKSAGFTPGENPEEAKLIRWQNRKRNQHVPRKPGASVDKEILWKA